MKRVILFLATNLAIMATISIVMSVLGVGPYLTQYGIDYTSLMIFCLLWGMGGAFISLLMSKWMAKMAMGVKIINPNQAFGEEAKLYQTVQALAQKAGLPKDPEVGIYQSDEINAFATGPSKSNSLVAVSTGLMRRMNKTEVDAVLAHEIAHIANGDMVTMTLIQGVVNAFVMFLARVAAFAVQNAMRSDDEESSVGGFAYFGLTMLFDILFSILASFVVAYFSRLREFAADRGSAILNGKEEMIAALKALKGTTELVDNSRPELAAMKISNKAGVLRFLSTHPSLDDRIERLRRMP